MGSCSNNTAINRINKRSYWISYKSCCPYLYTFTIYYCICTTISNNSYRKYCMSTRKL